MAGPGSVLIWFLSVLILIVGMVEPSKAHIQLVPFPTKSGHPCNAAFVLVAKKADANDGRTVWDSAGPLHPPLTEDVSEAKSHPLLTVCVQCHRNFLAYTWIDAKCAERVFIGIAGNGVRCNYGLKRPNSKIRDGKIALYNVGSAFTDIRDEAPNLPIVAIFRSAGDAFVGNNKNPLHLQFGPSHGNERLSSDVNRPSGFACLPDDCTQGENQRQRCNPFGPCYEFVPPLRLILAIVCLGCAVAINVCGRGWIRLLCVFPLGCCGWLILVGHRYWCEGEDGNYHEYSHSREIVTQKLLTRFYCCNTVIDMANVLSADKQTAIDGERTKATRHRVTDAPDHLSARRGKSVHRAGVQEPWNSKPRRSLGSPEGQSYLGGRQWVASCLSALTATI